MKKIICLGIALAAATPVLAETAPTGLRLVETESRIEMDSTGKLLSITTTPELPPEVKAAVEANLLQLNFAPPVKDGHAVAGVTYVQQDACAAPDGGVFQFAVKFRGNGPSEQRRAYLMYPRDALRANVAATWTLTYNVDAQGKAHIAELSRDSGGGNRFDRSFRQAIVDWVGALQYRPEQVAGQPVETKMQKSMAFVTSSTPLRVGSKELEHSRAAGSEACKLALAARDDEKRAVALDSPFRPLQAN